MSVIRNRIYLNDMTKTYHEFVKEHTTSEQTNPSDGSCGEARCGERSAADSAFTGCVKNAYGRNRADGKASGALTDTGRSQGADMQTAFAGQKPAAAQQLLAECLAEPERARCDGTEPESQDQAKGETGGEERTTGQACEAEAEGMVQSPAAAGRASATEAEGMVQSAAATGQSCETGETEQSAVATGRASATEAEGMVQSPAAADASAAMEEIYDKMALICGCQNAECGQTKEAAAKTRQEMTLEEYKKYIYDKIASIPIHPSQSKNSVSVYITDAGLEAMKNDPEYEAWVLDTLRRDFSFHDPWGGMGSGRYVFHTFGATREEYRGHSFPKEDPDAARRRRKKQESFWEKRRLRQKKRQKEYYEELMKKRALIRRIQQQLFIEKDLSWAAAAYEAKKRVH